MNTLAFDEITYFRNVFQKNLSDSIGSGNLERARVELAAVAAIFFTQQSEPSAMVLNMLEDIPSADIETIDRMFRALLMQS